MINSGLKFGLKEKVIFTIHAIFQRYSSINSVVIYGSRAKGNYREGSDIDLTIKDESGLMYNEFLMLRHYLNDLDTLYSFDISLYSELKNTALINEIDQFGVLFYEKS